MATSADDSSGLRLLFHLYVAITVLCFPSPQATVVSITILLFRVASSQRMGIVLYDKETGACSVLYEKGIRKTWGRSPCYQLLGMPPWYWATLKPRAKLRDTATWDAFESITDLLLGVNVSNWNSYIYPADHE